MDLLVASKTKIENCDIFNRNVRSLIVKVKFRLSYTLIQVELMIAKSIRIEVKLSRV